MMVPRVKLAYDSVRIDYLSSFIFHPPPQKVFDLIHPGRKNLTAIRGYKRLEGLLDDPRTDPQDRSWFGPHDRLFTEPPPTCLNGPRQGYAAVACQP